MYKYGIVALNSGINMKITITIPEEMNKLIEEYCEEFGATKSGYIQKCIKAGLTAKHEKFPEEFITPRENTDHLTNELPVGVFDINPTEPAKLIQPTLNKLAELRKLQEQVINKPTGTYIPAQDSLAQEYGFCPFCYIKKAKPVTLVTYLDQDQIKVEGKLCNECIVKARTSGNPVSMGGLSES